MSWLDAEMTPTGYTQAAAANAFWRTALASTKVPIPQSYYISPMARCLATANASFSTLPVWAEQPFAPMVKEVSSFIIHNSTSSTIGSCFLQAGSSYFAKPSMPVPVVGDTRSAGYINVFRTTSSSLGLMKKTHSGEQDF